MNRKWYFLEYVGALICAFMANVEYQFSYMNGIHLLLWIIYFGVFLYFKEHILYCVLNVLMAFSVCLSLIIGIMTNPQPVCIIFDSIIMMFLLVLAIVLFIKRRSVNPNNQILNELKYTIRDGNGTVEHPYILDENSLPPLWKEMIDEQNHKVSYALNGAGQEYKDFSLNIEDYILAGNKHKKQELGGYWIYQSDMPVFKNEGTLWIKTVIYLSYPDCQLLYELLKDYKQWQTIQKNILSLSKMSYEEGYSLLRKHQISKQHCQVLFKVLGMTDHILSPSVILDLVKNKFHLSRYQEAMEYQEGMLYCVYCFTYQGQWFQCILEDNWKIYPILYEPSSYYGQGIYQSFGQDFV